MNTRETNKAIRRRRILDAARQILADGGYGDLTTRGLAEAAGVTVPTIYNLLGGKDEVLATLIAEGTERVWEQWTLPESNTSLDTVDAWFDACESVIANDEPATRAMVVASGRVAGLYTAHEDGRPEGPAWRAVAMATRLCSSLKDSGLLRGRISPETLGAQMFICFRDPLWDWGFGQIGLDEFKRRFARGVYMLLCSDATDTTRQGLINRIVKLQASDTAELAAAAGEA